MRTIKHPHCKDNLEEYLIGLINGLYTLRQVSIFTGYTVVHLCNLKKRYQQEGKQVLINSRKGKKTKKGISDTTKERIISIYKEDFNGFNFHFFAKALRDFYSINYSYKAIYNILTSAGIASPEKHKIKKKKMHRPRYRREQGGDLIQLDATPYEWFAWCGDKTKYALHGAIDDAEEKITGLTMSQNECSYGYYDVLEQTFANFGVPAEAYTDRSSIFCAKLQDKGKLTIQEQLAGLHEKRTQWQRILSDLHINQILAWSPQAKGRVERMWRTLQGRLPWYFKKYRIKTIEAANRFLQNEYVNIFNEEFGLHREKQPVWREPPKNYQSILCSKFTRRCNSAGVISFQGYKFLVKAPHCACREVELCIFKDDVKVLLNNNYYPIESLDDITGGIGESLSESTRDIIQKYMLSDAKVISA